MPNVILTGLPRSGSTLTCHLLNLCEDTVALHEPLPIRALVAEHGVEALPAEIEASFADARHSLLERRRAVSKTVSGRIPDNTFGSERDPADQLRPSVGSRGEVSFEGKDLSSDFTLAIKHNAGFTAILEPLLERFPCRGIIRHPLAALASWNSVRIPTQQGFSAVGQLLDPRLDAALQRIHDRIERQLYMLEWFFERYARLLERRFILRYEDLIASGGRALEVVTPRAANLDEALSSRNTNPVYDPAEILDLGQRLLGRDGTFWEFYSRVSVEEMIRPLRQEAGA